jgi:hypothetical protein
MIEKRTATVFYAPTKRRRYFSMQAAISGEATALILKKHPTEQSEYDDSMRCTYGGWDIRFNEPDKFATMHRRLSRILTKHFKLTCVTEN